MSEWNEWRWCFVRQRQKVVVIAMAVGYEDGGSCTSMSNDIRFPTTANQSNGAMEKLLYYTKCSYQ